MQQFLGLHRHTEVDRITVRGVDRAVNEVKALFIKLPGLLDAQEEEAIQAPQEMKLKR